MVNSWIVNLKYHNMQSAITLVAGSREDNLHVVTLEIFIATATVNFITSLPFLLICCVTLHKANNVPRPLLISGVGIVAFNLHG